MVPKGSPVGFKLIGRTINSQTKVDKFFFWGGGVATEVKKKFTKSFTNTLYI